MRLMEQAAEVYAERRLTMEAMNLSANSEMRSSIIVLVNAARGGAKYRKDGKAEVMLAPPLDHWVLPIPCASRTFIPEVHEGSTAIGVIIGGRELQGFVPTPVPDLIVPSGEFLYVSGFVHAAYG